ncbi:MAG: methyltransferase domain-containing protein [Candidatus Binataceae bacterium]
MSNLAKAIEQGHYARKQLFCRDPIVAWSHASRFRLARRLVAPYAGDILLDYGCGDGTFLAMVHDLFPRMVGVDDAGQAADCRSRFGAVPGLSFETVKDLKDRSHDGAYGVLTCMEVLEHCVEDVAENVLADLRRLVARRGTVIISVPIEIGPALLGKQMVRTLAGWRELGDYKYRETYTARELFRMVFADPRAAIRRPVYEAQGASGPRHFHGHKGFNWRALRLKLERSFEVRETQFSPLGWLGGCLNSQAWFVCAPK